MKNTEEIRSYIEQRIKAQSNDSDNPGITTEMKEALNSIDQKNSEEDKLKEELHKVICMAINNQDLPYKERDYISFSVLPYVEKLQRGKEYVSDNFDDIWENEDCSKILLDGENLSPKFKELFKEVCRAWYDKGVECANINKNDNYLPEKLEEAINLYYDTYGNGHWYFENLSFFKFKDIVETFVKEYGSKTSIQRCDNKVIDGELNDYLCAEYNSFKKENGGMLSFARLQHIAMDICEWKKKQTIPVSKNCIDAAKAFVSKLGEIMDKPEGFDEDVKYLLERVYEYGAIWQREQFKDVQQEQYCNESDKKDINEDQVKNN